LLPQFPVAVITKEYRVNMLAVDFSPENEVIEETGPVSWLSRQVLRGRNVHHASTVACVRVKLGDLRGRSTASLPARFVDECIARFVTDVRVPPTAPDPQEIAALLRTAEGISLERLLLECLLVMERRLAFARQDFVPIGKAEVRQVGDPGEGVVEFIWSSRETAISVAASRLVVAEFNRMLACGGAPQDPSTETLDAEYDRLIGRCRRKEVSRATALMLLAARARGMHADLTGGDGVQFGQGALQRLAHSSLARDESMASVILASNKARTSRRLAKLGLPVPRHVTVQTTEGAIKAAQQLGFPVVVKPERGAHGNGVTVGVRDAEGMAQAVERAREGGKPGRPILVEELVRGATHRLLVIGGRFASAIRMDQVRVHGDGHRTIRQLIAALNADPVRDGIRLFPIDIDQEVLQCLDAAGRTLESVPVDGEEVLLRGTSNFSRGSTTTEVSDAIHPAHVELAERATAALGLRIAGVDVICTGIAQPPDAAGTRIIEVNVRPGLFTHTFPRQGVPRDVAGKVLDLIFPAPATGRVPTVLVVGRRGSLATANAIAAELALRGVTAGLASRQRCSIAGVALEEGDLRLHEAIVRLWRDPRVAALVAAIDPRRAVSTGLALETADVACLLPRDAGDDAGDYEAAVALAASACRGGIVVRQGDEGVMPALEEACRKGILRREAIHVLPEGSTAEDIAAAAADLLSVPRPCPEKALVSDVAEADCGM
jgi:cyanophycin synthetase